jgi:hypothetical protein
MISLKAFAPVLAETLGTTTAAVYERQRALVRQGLLPAPVGRGRGNGVPATAETVAMIIIAMMVTDNLSDTDDRVRRVAGAEFFGKRLGRHLPKPKCALTGKRNFKSAVVALLRMPEHPYGLNVTVSRNHFASIITWIDPAQERTHQSQFADWFADTGSNLTVHASLRSGTLQSLGAALRKASDDYSNSQALQAD